MIRFDDRFVRSLPADAEASNAVRLVRGAAYSKVSPTRVPSPKVLAWIPEVAALLGLPTTPTAEWTEVLAGNALLPGMVPYAAAYGGHQFGNWAGQLGDGRAITLGEVIAPDERRWELQLKGPGPTPYSRRADGRAVLRSSLRELVASEAMFHLGIPTTRALALVDTGEGVERDLLYDGHPRVEPGAITTRVAPSFLRFGTYELPASRGDVALLERLVNFTLETHFPELPRGRAGVVPLLAEVSRRTALLVMEWQRVGFVHGVMNTDNMSMLGLTVDYGPFGFLEGFDPQWTPNTTDLPGRRYAYGNQPAIAQWNLLCLANALVPLVESPTVLEAVLDDYARIASDAQLQMMRRKLGLVGASARDDEDERLMRECFNVLSSTETDLTLFFRRLARLSPSQQAAPAEALVTPLREAFYAPDEVKGAVHDELVEFLRRLLARAALDGRADAERLAAMNAANPIYVPRNFLAQTVITAAEAGDVKPLHEWLEVLRRPYEERPGLEGWATKRPEWARHLPGSSMLSCSS